MIARQDNRREEACAFLSQATTGSLATQGEYRASVALIYFCLIENVLVFKSRTTSEHSLNLVKNPQAAIGVYLHASSYKAKYGMQLKGSAARIRDADMMAKTVDTYSNAFAGAGAKLPSIDELISDDVSSTFYAFEIGAFKIVDEGFEDNRTMQAYEAWSA